MPKDMGVTKIAYKVTKADGSVLAEAVRSEQISHVASFTPDAAPTIVSLLRILQGTAEEPVSHQIDEDTIPVQVLVGTG